MVVLHPLGNRIYVQKREESLLQFLRVLMCLKKAIAFLMEIIVDLGFRSFKVLLKDDSIPTFHSKVFKAPITTTWPSPTNIN